MRFINNWVTPLTADLAAASTTLPIATGALDRLDLAAGGEYLLTIVGSLDPLEQETTERILVSFDGGGALVVARGQDGSTAQDWETGAYVFCSITASQAATWSTPSAAGGPKHGLVISSPGTYDFDLANHAVLKVYPSNGTYTVRLPRMETGEFAFFDFYVLSFGASNIIELAPSDDFGSGGITGLKTAGTGITVVIDGGTTRIIGLTGLLVGRAHVDEFGTNLMVFLQTP